MLRRALLILATTVGCIVIALSSYFLWKPETLPEEPPSTDSALATTLQTPPTGFPSLGPGLSVLNPAPPHANTILPAPIPNNPTLAATLISLNLDQADVPTAFTALGDASHIPVTVPRGRPRINNQPDPLITIHLTDQPLLEALLQIESQGFCSATITTAPAITAQYSIRRTLPGLWSISGPFAFAITTIRHSVTLDRQGNPEPGRGAAAGETVMLELTAHFEPKLHILRYPMRLDLIEAADDHGHSLIPPPGPTVLPNSFSNTNFPPRATLGYPTQNPGRIIKLLRATATYSVQLESTTVDINDPFNAPPSEKDISGIHASFGQITWNDTDHAIQMTATYSKGTFTGDWPATAQGLAGVKPRLSPTTTPGPLDSGNTTVSGDTVTARYLVRIPSTVVNANVVPPQKPSLQTFSLDIPIGAIQVAVPVEFKDIPLP